MFKEIVPLLSCPCCKKNFTCFPSEMENEEITEGWIECESGHRYPIHKGVLNMGSAEQEDGNTWSDYYQEMSYEELDRALEEKKTENQRNILHKFLKDTAAETAKLKQGFLLDIASGRGMLLSRMIENAGSDVHIISADLSFTVLMYDRLKFAEKARHLKVSYIACDATNLPFKPDSLDMACSFSGFLNMGSLFEAGIAEAARVLKKGAALVHATAYMNPETPGFREVEKILETMNQKAFARNLVQEDVLALHRKYFSTASDTFSYEGIAEGEEADLIPYHGDWFANAVITAVK